MPLDPSAITAGMNLGQAAGGRFGALNDSLGTLVNFLLQQKQMKDKMASESQMKMRDALISSGKVTPDAQGIAAAGFPAGWNPTPAPTVPSGGYPKGYSFDPTTNSYKMDYGYATPTTPEQEAGIGEKNASIKKNEEETLRLKLGAKPGTSTDDAIKNSLPHASLMNLWQTPNPTLQQIQDQRARLAGGPSNQSGVSGVTNNLPFQHQAPPGAFGWSKSKNAWVDQNGNVINQ